VASAPAPSPVTGVQITTSASGKKISKIDQDDINAVAAVLAGQKERYAVIYKRYYPIILQKFSSSLKFNKELAEDIAADLFTKVFQNLSGYKPKYTFNSWITRVAKNHLVDYVRKQKLDTVSLDAGVSSEKMRNEDSNSAVMEVKDDGVLNPEESILSQERNECIKNAVANLDDNCREVIKKLFYEDKSYVEIANEMNIPLGTLKSIVFRAKSKLKSMLEADKRALAVVMN
jgi:RNA polymerase sigma-70 factor (ECF subfamily)